MLPEGDRDREASYQMRNIDALDGILRGDEASADIDVLMLWAKCQQARRNPTDAINILNQVRTRLTLNP